MNKHRRNKVIANDKRIMLGLKKEKVTRTEGHTGTINMMRNPNGRPTNTSVTSNTGLRHMRICNVKASLKMRGSVTTR